MKDFKINEEITANKVFLIDENGEKLGEISYGQAMLLAYEKGLDLIEVGPDANPPACKLMDYNKEVYRREKQLRKQRAKQRSTEVKEIKLSLKIGTHDLEVKANRAKGFLQEGHKVKVFILLIGREMAFQNNARALVENFSLKFDAEIESPIKREGKKIWALLRAKK